jgi:hypothetical protein
MEPIKTPFPRPKGAPLGRAALHNALRRLCAGRESNSAQPTIPERSGSRAKAPRIVSRRSNSRFSQRAVNLLVRSKKGSYQLLQASSSEAVLMTQPSPKTKRYFEPQSSCLTTFARKSLRNCLHSLRYSYDLLLSLHGFDCPLRVDDFEVRLCLNGLNV